MHFKRIYFVVSIRVILTIPIPTEPLLLHLCIQTLIVMLCAFVCFRLIITGPVSHYFYQLMEVWIPTTDPLCIVKRLLLDRLFFAPGFLLVFYFVMNILEVGGLRNIPS